MTITEGVVLKERSVGEQDKFIDILTKNSGVLEVNVRGAKKINGKNGSSTQLFAYSRFCLDQRGDRLYLNSAEPIHIFYGLRSELTRISLASYFAEILRYCIAERADSESVMRLLLNTMHFLENGTRDEVLLRCIFEMRLMSEIGYMPDVLACRNCGEFAPEELCFSINDGGFFCKDCAGEQDTGGYFDVKLPVLEAVRHIVLSDFDRLFNFRVSESVLDKLDKLSAAYVEARLERRFATLDFYRSLTL